jgi:hypothetical protein
MLIESRLGQRLKAVWRWKQLILLFVIPDLPKQRGDATSIILLLPFYKCDLLVLI